MTRIRWITSIVFIVAIGIGILFAVNLGGDPTKPSSALVHQPAPEFKLTAFDGTSIDLATFKGKVVLVNFWNDWCAPCQQETPSMVALAKAHANDPEFVMVGIVHDPESHSAATEYARKSGMTYPLAFDPSDETGLNYGVTGQPETFLVNKAGIVADWISGPIDPNRMQAEILALEGT